MHANHPDLLSAIVEEYCCLKHEQNERIAFRDHLLYATLTVIGAVGYFSLSEHGSPHSLLLLPFVLLVLGWTYIENDAKISEIRTYVATHLRDQVVAVANDSRAQGIFAWEQIHRQGHHRKRHKRVQLAVDLLTFVGAGIATVPLYCILAPSVGYLAMIAIFSDCVLMTILAYEIYHHYSYEATPPPNIPSPVTRSDSAS